MPNNFSEKEVHEHIYQTGLESLMAKDGYEEDVDEAEVSSSDLAEELPVDDPESDDPAFELWKLIKAKAEEKLRNIHQTLRYGEFVGSNINLPTDSTRPMELDLLGTYSDGIFILELKVNRSAERNAFSELFAYSNYIAEMFALSGHKDITNVLVAKLDVKITRQAFLYDLLIADRNIIVYQPVFSDNSLESLHLDLYLPSDEDYEQFTNRLLSHDAMACVVASFEDIPGWIDSDEEDGGPKRYTIEYLEGISGYAAQLMESEGLHGFCFARKPWKDIPLHYRNSLLICAVNPFELLGEERVRPVFDQLSEAGITAMLEDPKHAFSGRLIRLAQRTLNDTLKVGYSSEYSTPIWSVMVTSFFEVVATHNLGFRPTGLLREAYASVVNATYARNEVEGSYIEDVSMLKIDELTNWLKAWTFMERCGFTGRDEDEDDFGL